MVTNDERETAAAVFGIDTKQRAPLPPIPRELMRDPEPAAPKPKLATVRTERRWRVVRTEDGRYVTEEVR